MKEKNKGFTEEETKIIVHNILRECAPDGMSETKISRIVDKLWEMRVSGTLVDLVLNDMAGVKMVRGELVFNGRIPNKL